jgi:hypothetical protein
MGVGWRTLSRMVREAAPAPLPPSTGACHDPDFDEGQLSIDRG